MNGYERTLKRKYKETKTNGQKLKERPTPDQSPERMHKNNRKPAQASTVETNEKPSRNKAKTPTTENDVTNPG